MPFTPQDFVSKWKRVTACEKQTYQEHFIDLCHLVGQQTPNNYDPTGTRFGFEIGAVKTNGRQVKSITPYIYCWRRSSFLQKRLN
jgi:hypothetical protein